MRGATPEHSLDQRSPPDPPRGAVYAPLMRRIQLYLDEELDHAVSAEAARTGQTRSELVRTAVRSWLGDAVGSQPDPIEELIGSVDIDPVDDLDAAIYE